MRQAGEVAGEAFAGLETNTALAFESAMAAASTDADASVAAAREAVRLPTHLFGHLFYFLTTGAGGLHCCCSQAARAAAEVKAKADAEARAAEEKAAAAEVRRSFLYMGVGAPSSDGLLCTRQAARLAAIKAEEDKRLAEVAAADQQRAKEAKVVVALQEYLAHNPAAFPAFKQASGQYRFAQIDADQYFTIVSSHAHENET